MRIVLFAEALLNRAGIERMIVEISNLLIEKYEVKILLINHFDKKLSPFYLDSRILITSINLLMYSSLQ